LPQRFCRRYRSIRAAVSNIGADLILHAGIGLRWPFARPARLSRP